MERNLNKKSRKSLYANMYKTTIEVHLKWYKINDCINLLKQCLFFKWIYYPSEPVYNCSRRQWHAFHRLHEDYLGLRYLVIHSNSVWIYICYFFFASTK